MVRLRSPKRNFAFTPQDLAPFRLTSRIDRPCHFVESRKVPNSVSKLKFRARNFSLDRVHQSMILFATGCDEALKRFLLEDGVGQEAGFWKLAQALNALYPTGTQEKRWVDGVLARKKGLGL